MAQQQTKPEFHGLEGYFLSLERMRRLSVKDGERQFRIIRRCNWYMFSASGLRGKAFDNSYEFFRLCQTAEPNCPEEQQKPNLRLAHSPPPKAFLAKYHSAYPEGSRFAILNSDAVPIGDIQHTLTKSWNKWRTVSTKARRLEAAIDSIPNPKRIKKVVCLGLGRILEPFVESLGDPDSANRGHTDIIAPRNIAQHLAAIAIVKQLERMTGQYIPLYTADPEYGPRHKRALETLLIGQFTVLDPSYGKHEQFTVIDDNTLLFNMAGPPHCPTMRIIQEYARPVAIITKEVPREGDFQDRLWFEVTEEDGTKVQVPGCADIPLPAGCRTFGGLCPKRVRDMIVDEYDLEPKFPAEEGGIRYWKDSDLIDYEDRDSSNTRAGGYWLSHTRLYVRKDKVDMPVTPHTRGKVRLVLRWFKKLVTLGNKYLR
ncbi:hypothetical protein Hte_010602 [Hypoxylon texense]